MKKEFTEREREQRDVESRKKKKSRQKRTFKESPEVLGTGEKMTTLTEADRRKILESLTSDELATFQEAFTVFDKNHDGTITTKVTLTHCDWECDYFASKNLLRFYQKKSRQS